MSTDEPPVTDSRQFSELPQEEKDTRLHAALADWTNEALVDRVREMLDGGANPNARDARGLTPLLALASMGAGGPKLYQAFADRGADLTLSDENGNTALHLLAAGGSGWKEMRWLLGDKFPIETKNNAGHTILHRAASSDYHSALKMVKTIFDKGADPIAKDHEGRTPADIAKGECTQWLLEKTSAPMAAPDKDLLVAVGAGDVAKARAALEAGANPCAVDVSDKTYGPNNVGQAAALHVAMNKRLPHEIAELVIAKATDINVRDLDGRTALHHVLDRNDGDNRAALVEQLLARGADVDALDKWGAPPVFELLSFWEASNEIALLDRLAAAGANLSATGASGETMVDKMFERTQRFNETNDKTGFVELILALLERGVSTSDPKMRKHLDNWLSSKGSKYSSKIPPAPPAAPAPTLAVDLALAGAHADQDVTIEIEGEPEAVALFDWLALERAEEDDESRAASEIWEYHIHPSLEDVVRAYKLVPFGVLGMSGSFDSWEEISTLGTLFVITVKAAGGDAPVLFVPNEGTIHRLTEGAEPRELAMSYKQLLATVTAEPD